MNPTAPLLDFLFDSTLVGGALAAFLLVLQYLGRRLLAPKWLALAWVLVSLRFLLPVSGDLPCAIRLEPPTPALTEILHGAHAPEARAATGSNSLGTEVGGGSFGVACGLLAVWALGMVVSASQILVQALRLHRLLRQRQSTDHDLLELLESAKTRLNIHSPIGLIVSAPAGTPMIVGWLRPRIILPASFTARLSSTEITRIFVHELSHFKSADVLALWLAAVVRVVHWYNPLAYVLGRQLRARQEEACDVRAMRVLHESGFAYGQALLNALRIGGAQPMSVGAVAVVSSFHDLRARVRLLTSSWRFSSFLAAGMMFFLALFSLVTTTSAMTLLPEATPSAQAALPGTLAWVARLDRGDYEGSWNEASPKFFQKPIPRQGWVASISSVRQPVGTLESRQLRTQTFLPVNPQGFKGPFVVTVFNTKFAQMPAAIETVTFVLDSDGQWRASDYFLRPDSVADFR
ncbi:MAG TPA: M56 family metallopeptidase [Candidatus Methylacidiphilales bacterium]